MDGRVPEARNLARSSEDFAQMGECFNALMVASAIGDTETVKILLQRGMDPNAQSPYCYLGRAVTGEANLTALMFAARVEIARVLIQGGADPDKITTDTDTALHRAISEDRFDVALYLIEAGANVNHFDFCGNNIYLYRIQRKLQFKPELKANLTPIKSRLLAKGAHSFQYNEDLGSRANLPGKTLTHLPTGTEYELKENWLSRFPDPNYHGLAFIPLGKKYAHKSEFEWTQTGENLWSFTIHSNIFLDQSRRIKSKCY